MLRKHINLIYRDQNNISTHVWPAIKLYVSQSSQLFTNFLYLFIFLTETKVYYKVNATRHNGCLLGSKIFNVFLVHDFVLTAYPGIQIEPSWSWSYGIWIYNCLCNQCLSPLTLWVRIPFRRGVLDTTVWDKVCQWLAVGRWFSLCTPAFSTNKADRHIITEILLKVALNTNPKPQVQILIKSNIPSIGMSRRGWYVEIPLRVTCEWRSYIPFNENGDSYFMKVLLNCFACYEQSDWSKKVITVFIISLYIHDIMSIPAEGSRTLNLNN